MIQNILFVCTGNTCRSVIAEHLLQKYLDEGIEVSSCGTSVYSGIPFPETLRELLREEGIEIVSHTPVPIQKSFVSKADLILVMEEVHRRRVISLFPDSEKKVFLLKEFAELGTEDVADPFGGSRSVYMRCLEEIKECLRRIIPRLKKERKDCP
jgi:protein-tyrosine-phosphatase